MNVRELIRDLLVEANEDKKAKQIYKELEGNEIANTEVGVDHPDFYEVCYIEDISNEFPAFIGLNLEDKGYGDLP
jgi:hypothetical protein